MSHTLSQYREVLASCRKIFEKKAKDYGTAWRILRPSSITDQIFIKAKRIRSIQETGVNKVGEPVNGEFQALVNYGIIALIQLGIPEKFPEDLTAAESLQAYDRETSDLSMLFCNKNHDYGEAWRDMRVSSMTDLILMKILRIKQIEDNNGRVTTSEGVDEGYKDIANYSIFCQILLKEDEEKKTVERGEKLKTRDI